MFSNLATNRHRLIALVPVFALMFSMPCKGSKTQDVPGDKGVGQFQPTLSDETLGDLLVLHREYQAAIAAYNRIDKKTPILWNKIGVAYQHLYAFDEAAADYRKALQLWPGYPDALNNLGTVYYDQKDYGRAEKCYKDALKRKPKTAVYLENLGTAYFADKKPMQGSRAYQTAFAADPEIFEQGGPDAISEPGTTEEKADLDLSMASIFAHAGLRDQAMEYLQKAVNDGFRDRKKLLDDGNFAGLRKMPDFVKLVGELDPR